MKTEKLILLHCVERHSFHSVPKPVRTLQTMIVCELNTGGAVKCSPKTNVLRIGLYDNFSFTGVLRLVLEIVVFCYCCYWTCRQIKVIHSYRTDSSGVVIGHSPDAMESFIYDVRMTAGNVVKLVRTPHKFTAPCRDRSSCRFYMIV